MKWFDFHDPDISLPVLRRNATRELLEMIGLTMEILFTRGRCLMWGRTFDNRSSYYAAKSRLLKQGLIIEDQGPFKKPRLLLSHQGLDAMDDAFKPEKRWKHKWDGRWYQLIYDIPEADRHYRDNLRRFVKILRMGCLQKSVYISPFDIRPVYDDLMQAASPQPHVFLFEAQTVLGLPSQRIVEQAWDFDELHRMQERFCKSCMANLNKMKTLPAGKSVDIEQMRRDAYLSFRGIMEQDPLLPESLWPKGYLGREMFGWFRELQYKSLEKIAS